jgi:hypothetical protein
VSAEPSTAIDWVGGRITDTGLREIEQQVGSIEETELWNPVVTQGDVKHFALGETTTDCGGMLKSLEVPLGHDHLLLRRSYIHV